MLLLPVGVPSSLGLLICKTGVLLCDLPRRGRGERANGCKMLMWPRAGLLANVALPVHCLAVTLVRDPSAVCQPPL